MRMNAYYDLPEACACMLPGTTNPIILARGMPGYWPGAALGLHGAADIAAFNNRHHVTPRILEAMKVGAFFNWDAPGADPNHPCWNILDHEERADV